MSLCWVKSGQEKQSGNLTPRVFWVFGQAGQSQGKLWGHRFIRFFDWLFLSKGKLSTKSISAFLLAVVHERMLVVLPAESSRLRRSFEGIDVCSLQILYQTAILLFKSQRVTELSAE